jgi:hypothetical protein
MVGCDSVIFHLFSNDTTTHNRADGISLAHLRYN